MSETILIGMAIRNGAPTIRRAVLSVLRQQPTRRAIHLLIVDDNSTDSWQNEIKDLIPNPRITIRRVSLGSPHATRNYIRQFAHEPTRHFSYIARLDCDDELASSDVLQRLDTLLDQHAPDVLIMGNLLRKNNRVLKRINKARQDLLKSGYLDKRLKRMSEGVKSAELPSCNLVIRRSVDYTYPAVGSAEDHWLTVDLLLRKHQLRIHVAEDLFYSIYSLSGTASRNNRKHDVYLLSRKQLYQHYLSRIGAQREP